VSKTNNQYDIVFLDTFSESTMPTHLSTEQFFADIYNILSEHSCLATNANLSTTDAFHRLIKALSSTFEENILLAHNNILENSRVIISGTRRSLMPIASKKQAIEEAERLQCNAHFEFNLAQLLSIAYQGSLNEITSSK
jgi:spermidine synthase